MHEDFSDPSIGNAGTILLVSHCGTMPQGGHET